MSATHFAARVEDRLNDRLVDLLVDRGWRPRVLPYTGYGSLRFARVLGRVVVSPESREEVARDPQPERRGWRSFITAQQAGVEVHLRLGDVEMTVSSDRGGYIDVHVEGHGLEPGWHDAMLRIGDREVAAPVCVIGDETTFGIVSDIDDTCLVTMLPRPMLAAYNSFVLQETARRVVPGMAAMFRSLLAYHPGAPIIYLSTGAWNVQPALSRFLRRHAYPDGPLLLTDWGPTADRWFRSGRTHKMSQLRRLMEELPQIQWVLVGDDGQHDPKIYEDIDDEFPGRVRCIGIRQLTVGQQLLSHGTPVAKNDAQQGSDAPVLQGPDGFVLHRLVTQTLRAQGDAEQADERRA